ncbi:MAG: sugar ABC transporter ATP-binding protein [Acidimicrobiales bacterium]
MPALSKVSMDLRRGEVHGLVGANGAGKSTLIRILAGLVAPDEGSIAIDGRSYAKLSQGSSRSLGFAFIHQELRLVSHFTGVENALLGLPKPKRLGIVKWGAAERQVRLALEPLGGDFSLTCPVKELSVANQWLIVIVRALLAEARLIAMDEPTASLSEGESKRLYEAVARLAASGITVLYVSHKLEEVTSICDRITVFRGGTVVGTVTKDIDRRELVALIVGHALRESSRLEQPIASEVAPLVQARRLSRAPAVRNVSLDVRAGEILGLAGLIGSGRSEVARMLAGVDQPDSGSLVVGGRPVRFRSPYDAMRHGIAYVPEERRSQGLFLTKSVRFNISLGALAKMRVAPFIPIIAGRKADGISHEFVARLGIRTPSLATPVGALSGGNQQKVLLARFVATGCRVLIADEPTRGVDVGAREEMYQLMDELARGGLGIVFISSEIEELVGRCNRIVVLSQGSVVAEVDGTKTTKQELDHLCYLVPGLREEVTVA